MTGVIVRDAQNGNRYIQFNAARGVILATGDNGADERIMKHFAPEIVEKKITNLGALGMMGMDVEGKPCPTGDGLRMGAWIGAKVQDFHAPMTHHMGGGMGVTPFLQLNKHGKRFMNESIPGQQLENQIELQPDQTTFQIYDSKWPEQIPYMPANHGGLCYIIPEDEDESNPNFTDRQYTKVSAKANAYNFKADTLDELFAQLGYTGEALENARASVERYNQLCREGYDADFGKDASRMFPLENGPFYACTWSTTAMLVCVGGLESDENCHTFTGTAEDPRPDSGPVCLRQRAGQPLRGRVSDLLPRHQPFPVRLLRLHRRQELRAGRITLPSTEYRVLPPLGSTLFSLRVEGTSGLPP